MSTSQKALLILSFLVKGDPSIAEILIRSAWASKGLSNPGWKPGMVPWETVIMEFSPEEYGRHFADLLETAE